MNNRELPFLHIIHEVDGHADPVEPPKDDPAPEPKPDEDPAPEPKDDGDGKDPKPVEPVDPSGLSLDQLKDLNPEVAKLITESEDAHEKLREIEEKREEDAENKMKEEGKWKELAETEKSKRKELEKEVTKKDALLDSYISTTKNILEGVINKIPEEKKALIPEKFSEKQKLEYIQKNSEWFRS